MSFILLAADWPNTSLQAAIKEGLMSSSPMEYGFLHLAQKPWKQEWAKIPDWPRRRAVAEFRLCVGHDCLKNIFTALEFVPTPTACCAASTKPWTGTILDDVPHYPVGQIVSDTGEARTKMMEYWLFSLLLLRDYSLSLGLLCLFWMVLMCSCF